MVAMGTSMETASGKGEGKNKIKKRGRSRPSSCLHHSRAGRANFEVKPATNYLRPIEHGQALTEMLGQYRRVNIAKENGRRIEWEKEREYWLDTGYWIILECVIS